METKDAIRTCVLSRRWRYMWITVPCLNFNIRFSRLADFDRFVKLVLSQRDETDQWLLKEVVELATSHCVEEIRINFAGKISDGTSLPIQISSSLFASQSMKEFGFKSCHPANAPESIFGCKSLEILHLEHSLHPHQANSSNPFSFIRDKLLGFTELTTLHLNRFTLICPRGTARLDPFADFVNLKDLHLSEICFKSDVNPVDFVISAPRLDKLTLACNHFRCKVVVVAPHLTNLSYIHSSSHVYFEIGLPSFDDFRIGVREAQIDGLTVYRRTRSEEILHSFINISM